MKKIISCIILTFILAFLSSSCYAFDPSSIKQPTIDPTLSGMLGGVIGIIQIVGLGIAVIAAIALGIRYMVSSVEEKATIKNKLIPFVIGAVIFFGATGILRIIAGIAGWF